MELLFENEYIQIRLNRKHQCVECQCQAKKDSFSNHQIKYSMEKVYEFVCKNNCNKLLPLMGDMTKIPDDILMWVESDWFPRLVRKGVRTYAIVSPNSELTQKINAKNPRNFNGIITAYFNDVIKARSWIASLPN